MILLGNHLMLAHPKLFWIIPNLVIEEAPAAVAPAYFKKSRLFIISYLL
jgi:hypothetical protein